MSRVAIKIGPGDHGRRMSLAEFEHAEVQEGHIYELERAVIVVSDAPKPRHFMLLQAVRDQLVLYRASHPDKIVAIMGGGDSKILVTGYDSERHPDIAVYKTPPPPAVEEDDDWSSWVPELIVEVVSPSSRKRDYEEKPEEYLAFGVKEYWIVDDAEDRITVLRRTGQRWVPKTIGTDDTYKTRLLPGFELDVARVLER